MSDPIETNQVNLCQPAGTKAASPTRSRRSVALATAAGAALLLIGAGVGAGAYGIAQKERLTFDTALATTPIAQLEDTDRVEIQGKVVEIYGNKFVLQDAGARTLVETGRSGEGGKLVAKDEVVTVQGRFDDGFLRATALQRANGDVDELQPPPPPPHHNGPGMKP